MYKLTVSYKNTWEGVVDKGRDVVAVGTVAIEDAVDPPIVHLQDEEIVLIGAFRLQTLLAREADVEICAFHTLGTCALRLLVVKALLGVVRLLS